MSLTITLCYACAVSYIIIYVNRRYSLFIIQNFYFLLFCQDYIKQRVAHQVLIYRKTDFLQYLNGVLSLGLSSRILCYGKTPKLQKDGTFCTFLSVVNTLVKKISIINSHHLFLVLSHLFNSSVAFDNNFPRFFLFIPSKILQKLSLQFLEEMLLC